MGENQATLPDEWQFVLLSRDIAPRRCPAAIMPSANEAAALKKSKPKIACVPCAKGKRSCSGTFPCDRCKRLGKECAYPTEATRTRTRRRRVVQVELLPHAYIHGGADTFGTPAPTPLSLPRQLFPWQDIRLHAVAPQAYMPLSYAHGEEDSMLGVLASATTNAATAALNAAASALWGAVEGEDVNAGIVASGADKESYLKFLWDTTLPSDSGHRDASVMDDDEDDDGSDGEYEGSSGNGGRSTRGRSMRRRTYRDADSDDDDEYDEDDESVSDAGDRRTAGKRGRGGSAVMQRGETKRARVATVTPAPAFPPPSAGPVVLSSQALAARHLREMSAIASALDDPVPCIAAIFDTTNTYSLQKLVCNVRALELFGWSQAEVNLRVQLGHVIRWLHPEDVLVRSVIAVNARRGCLASYTHEGRYLRRKAGSVIPHQALRVLTAGIKQREAQNAHAEEVAASTAAAALSADGLPPMRPRMTAVSSTTGSVFGIDDEDVLAALTDVDESVTYTVFAACEHVSNTYDDVTHATHIVITKFMDVSDGSGVVRYPSIAGVTLVDEEEDVEEIVNPSDFDISEERCMHEDDASLLLAAAHASRAASLSKTNSSSTSTSAPPPQRAAPHTMFPVASWTYAASGEYKAYTAGSTTVSSGGATGVTTAPPVLPITTGLRTMEERSITTQLILLRDSSALSADGGVAEPVVDPFGDKAELPGA